jgi:hypothetical protein
MKVVGIFQDMPKIDTASNCPCCGKKLDGATSLDNQPVLPSKGDLSICFYCATVSIFDENLNIKQLTKEEFSQLPEDIKTSIRSARDSLIEFRIRKGL